MQPQRVGVTGHQVLPEEAIALLTSKLELWFPDARGTTVVCSLALGADTLVAEYLVGRGANLHAILPSGHSESTFDEDSAKSRYQDLLDLAEVVEILGFEEPSEEAYMAAGALVARSCDWLIAVWDGREARGLGGTGDVVALARQLGKDIRAARPAGVTR